MSSSCLTVVGDVMQKKLLASSVPVLIAVVVVAGVMQPRDDASRDPHEKRVDVATSLTLLSSWLRRPGADVDARLPSFVVPEHRSAASPSRHLVLIDVVTEESVALVTRFLPRSSRGPPAG